MENLDLINFTDSLLSKNTLSFTEINKAIKVSQAYMQKQQINDYKSKIFSNNTFKIFIKYHVNMHSKLNKRSDYFYLEGVENMINIVNMYHLQNTGIAEIVVFGEDKKKLKKCTYKSNYDENITVKGLLFREIL